MSAVLLLGIAGLAMLDSLNPATIIAVTLVLLGAERRPILSAAAVVAGALLTVFTLGSALFLTAGAAAGAVDGILIVLRFLAFGAAGVGLVVVGIRRFRDRPRRGIRLPEWFSPATAIGLGILMTAADLPNAFPYFIAIERMVDAGVEPLVGLAVLAGYAIVYCLPCMVLLVIGALARERTRAWLDRLVTRFSSGVVKRSVWNGVFTIAAGLAVASVPFWI